MKNFTIITCLLILNYHTTQTRWIGHSGITPDEAIKFSDRVDLAKRLRDPLRQEQAQQRYLPNNIEKDFNDKNPRDKNFSDDQYYTARIENRKLVGECIMLQDEILKKQYFGYTPLKKTANVDAGETVYLLAATNAYHNTYCLNYVLFCKKQNFNNNMYHARNMPSTYRQTHGFAEIVQENEYLQDTTLPKTKQLLEFYNKRNIALKCVGITTCVATIAAYVIKNMHQYIF